MVEPLLTFDYRHKPVNRIPIPQRPKWLLDMTRGIREFEPQIRHLDVQQRRFESWSYPMHRQERPYAHPIDRRRPTEPPREEDTWRRHPPPEIDDYGGIDEDKRTPRWEEKAEEWEEKSPADSGVGEMKKGKRVTLIEDLLCPPGRFSRPSKIVIILRGPPGSGKTTLAKLIKDKEVWRK